VPIGVVASRTLSSAPPAASSHPESPIRMLDRCRSGEGQMVASLLAAGRAQRRGHILIDVHNLLGLDFHHHLFPFVLLPSSLASGDVLRLTARPHGRTPTDDAEALSVPTVRSRVPGDEV
jgi:hypothetical protein